MSHRKKRSYTKYGQGGIHLSLFVLACAASGCKTDDGFVAGNGAGGSSTPYSCEATPSECLNDLAGLYEGTYSGDLEGTWRVTVDIDGSLSGTTHNTSTGDEYSVSGTADDEGDVVFGTVSDGSAFQGRVYSDYTISGTWSLEGHSGDFEGRRVSAVGADDDSSDGAADCPENLVGNIVGGLYTPGLSISPDFSACVISTCSAEYAQCFGQEWLQGLFGGTCGDYMQCLMDCGCHEGCTMSCYPCSGDCVPTAECEACEELITECGSPACDSFLPSV